MNGKSLQYSIVRRCCGHCASRKEPPPGAHWDRTWIRLSRLGPNHLKLAAAQGGSVSEGYLL